MSRLRRFALFAALCLTVAAARADEAQNIDQMFRQGNLTGALAQADQYLAQNPKDAQVRFIKGLILSEQGKTDAAIAVFIGLTQDYPELPEPYNNLAVLYAAQGKYADAKNALEIAIHTHPGYATAEENLGDLYARMAADAYARALQLKGGSAALQGKLDTLNRMLAANKGFLPAPAQTPAAAVKK